MRLRLVASVALAALPLLPAPASAQPADGRGVYAVLGSAAPERVLLPTDVDPFLIVGYRFSDHADVQGGVRVGTATRIRDRSGGRGRYVPLDPYTAYIKWHGETIAATASAGVTAQFGGAEFRSRASLSYDVFDRTLTMHTLDPDAPLPDTPVRPEEWGTTTVDRASATFAHSGLSAIVALPIERKTGRVAPGLGLAVTSTRRLGGSIEAPPVQWMAFVSLPTTVEVGTVRVTLDATLGMTREALGRSADLGDWRHTVATGLRVDL